MKTNAAAGNRGGKLRKRHWRILGYPVALVLALGLPTLFSIGMGIYDWRVQRALDELEEAIRAKGEPLTRADLDAAYDAGMRSHPGAAAYLEAVELLAQIDEVEEQERRVISTHSFSSSAGIGRFNQAEMVDACTFIEKRAPVLAAAAMALDGTAGDLPSTSLSRDFSSVQFYRLRRLLETRGLIALEERDWDTFVQVQRQIIDMGQFARVVGEIPFDRLALDFIHDAIVAGDLPISVHETLTSCIAQINVAEDFRYNETNRRQQIREELERYYLGDIDLGDYAPGPFTRSWRYRKLRWLPGMKALARNDILRRMRQSTAIIEDTGLPWPERYANAIRRKPFDTEWVPFDEFEAVQQSKSWLQRRIDHLAGANYEPDNTGAWWVRRTYTDDGRINVTPLRLRDLIPLFSCPERSTGGSGPYNLLFHYDDYTERYISFEMRLRAMRLSMLVDGYRQQCGHLPETLDALDAEAVVEIGGDPYNGNPLGYEVVERGFVLYSVGADLVDGGEEHMGDLVLEFAADPPPVPRERREEASGRGNRGGVAGLD